MKIRFNKFERVAGLFVLVALVASAVFGVGVAVQQGWFASRREFHTVVEKGQGIFPGTRVEMAGLKVGVVDRVEFGDDNSIQVHFTILEKYADRVRDDSNIRTARMFVIGDKFLDLSMGTKDAKVLKNGSFIPSETSFDLLEMLDGRGMGPYMKTLSQVSENLKVIAEAFSDPERTRKLIRMFDRLDPLLGNANKAALALVEMSDQMTDNQHLRTTLKNLARTTIELNNMIEEMPNMGKEMGSAMKTAHQMVLLMNEMLPMIKDLAPKLPHATQKTIEALDEAVIVLKAMQKSFLLRGAVSDVKDEEEAKRKAASEAKP